MNFIQDIGTLTPLTTNSSFLLATPMRRFFFLPKFRKLVTDDFLVHGLRNDARESTQLGDSDGLV
jgi:hypothetical protein